LCFVPDWLTLIFVVGPRRQHFREIHLRRFFERCAVVAVLLLSATALIAGESISTHCEESELALDSQHIVSRLGRCGDAEPDDLLWHLDRLDQIGGSLDGHFSRRNRGAGSVVYVMDTGVLATHDEFETTDHGSRVVAGYDVAGSVPMGASTCHSANKAIAPCYEDFSELPAASHGTSVASLVAGRYVGVAPDADIVSIRVMNERGLATTRTYIDGLDAIIRHAYSASAPQFQTAVVNISGWVLDRLNSTSSDGPTVSYSSVERKMVDMIFGVDARGHRDVHGRKFLFVVAGNNVDGGCGRSGVVDRFPAILGREIDGIVTVGGMTSENSAWLGSCRGGVEVLAPAQGVFSATITAHDHYRGKNSSARSGTSFAAPIIAGIAALMLSDHPDLTPEQLEAWITTTPSRVGNPDRRLADGKVAYTSGLDPIRTLAQQQARLAP
jgi:subtilisin family serine protease